MNSFPEPTDRQAELIEKIEAMCDVDFEDWCAQRDLKPSKYAASRFIDEYIDEYRRQCGY